MFDLILPFLFFLFFSVSLFGTLFLLDLLEILDLAHFGFQVLLSLSMVVAENLTTAFLNLHLVEEVSNEYHLFQFLSSSQFSSLDFKNIPFCFFVES